MDGQQTAADREWFNQPVNVQVEQDNRAWLDTMLDMKQPELQNYAIYQYSVPETAVTSSSRNDLIQLIVMANKAGGGASVSTQEYMYLKQLNGILQPVVTQKDPSDEPLYLVRGTGAGRQVYDMATKTWHNLKELLDKNSERVAQNMNVAQAAAAAPVAAAPVAQPVAPVAPAEPAAPSVGLSALMPLLPKLNRSDLNKVAAELKIEGADDAEKFPSNKDLIAEIEKVNGKVVNEGN